MTHARPKTGQAELLSIQYLRGLAALTVLVSHTLQWPLHQMSQTLLRSGRLGVEVFFVISGFIITKVAGDGAFDRVTFLKRRAWRIVPLYWGATLIVTDLCFNVRHSPHGMTRFFMKLNKAYGRFGPSRIMRSLIKDRAALRASIDHVLAWKPQRIVVSHGEDVTEDAAGELDRAFAFLR